MAEDPRRPVRDISTTVMEGCLRAPSTVGPPPHADPPHPPPHRCYTMPPPAAPASALAPAAATSMEGVLPVTVTPPRASACPRPSPIRHSRARRNLSRPSDAPAMPATLPSPQVLYYPGSARRCAQDLTSAFVFYVGSGLTVLCGCAQVDVGLSDGSYARGAIPSGASTGMSVCSMPPSPFTPRFHFSSAPVPELLLGLIDLGASRDLSGGISRSIDVVWLRDMFATRRVRLLTVRGGFGTIRGSTLKLGGMGGSWRWRQRHGVRSV
jgi:hypothetical protein